MTAPPDTVSRRVNAERIVVLGWSRAILIQLAHPLVAAGVAEHSSFRRGRLTAVVRLHHTIRAMLALTFGDDAARASAVDGIRRIHRRVHGRLIAAAGRFPAGTPYSAEDPDLVLWVHVTLLESIPLIYDRLVAHLTADDADAYCVEAAGIAVELGARDQDVPRSMDAVASYLDRMYASGAIAVSDQARQVASAVLSPPLAALVAPLARINRTITVGLLPPTIRGQYGFAWNHRQEQRLDRTFRFLRRLHDALPRAVALWPEAL